MKLISINSRFIRFIFVGILNTAFGYGVYLLLLNLGLHFATAALISTVFGILFNFRTIGSLVFQSKNNHLIIRFVCVYGILFLINISAIKVLSLFNISYGVGGGLMLVPMAFVGFLLNKKFVFKHD